MSFRFYFLFLTITFLLLFYPGAGPYFNIIAFNKNHFFEQKRPDSIKINPIPVVNKAAAPPAVTAQGVYIVDGNSLTPLYAKNEHKKFYPASTTKIVTALVALDLYSPDDIITVKNASTEGQVMNLRNGERITVENLLYGMLVYSGNDAAKAFATNKGYDTFIGLMNKKAQDLHMKDTTFRNPMGLDDMHQQTTPYDLTLAARELLKNPYLTKIVGTKEITISDVDYTIFHQLTNVNKLLGEIQGLGGLKTGYTEFAGENLVSFYKHQGHDFIIVVLKSEDRFNDTRVIVNWLTTNVTYTTPLILPTE
ncbi:N/A [soil metagenome]